jgi:hypothetical protein
MKQSLTTTRHTYTNLVKITTVILLFFGSFGIIGSSFFLRQALSSRGETETITDTSRYRDIRHQAWTNKTQIQHFPIDIPTDATDVRIAYSPGSLQGGSFFQLRLKQTPETIQKLLTQYQTTAKHKYRGGNTNDHTNQKNGVPTTFFYTSDSQEESFPTSYEILVLNANDRGTPDFKWNHGDSYGVAIDNLNSEIIYWAEEW